MTPCPHGYLNVELKCPTCAGVTREMAEAAARAIYGDQITPSHVAIMRHAIAAALCAKPP